MTPAGEMWELAGTRVADGPRSMRTVLQAPLRLGGTTHTPSAARMASTPAPSFPTAHMACPNTPRVPVSREALISLHGGEEGWLVVPTRELSVGQGFRVLDTCGDCMVVIRCVALGVDVPYAHETLARLSSGRARLAALGLLPAEPEFHEPAAVYMQFGSRGLAGAPHRL